MSIKPAKRVLHLRVPVRPEEEAKIRRLAAATGLSVAEYLRRVGLGYQPKSRVDQEQVAHLRRLGGNLGRLGGLLKWWLADDAKLAEFKPLQVRDLVVDALNKIGQTQQGMQDALHQMGRR